MNDRVVDLLEENLDLALRVGSLKDSSMIARKLLISRFVTCASPEYLQEYGMPMIPEDLVNHNCFIFEHPLNPTIWRFQGSEKRHEISVSGNLRTNMVKAIMEGALAGGGISWFPYWFVYKEIQQGDLEVILPEYEVFVGGFDLYYIYVLYPDNRFLPEKVRAFIDFLVEALKKIEKGMTRLEDKKEIKL